MNGISHIYWYVFFVKTGYETDAADEMKRVWKINDIVPFIPKYNTNFKKGGKVMLEKRNLFPGYVFVETDIPDREFALTVNDCIQKSRNVYKLLNYDDGGSHAMSDFERNAFMSLYGMDYCIQMSKGMIIGDRVIIMEGALVGYENRIKHINRHKYEATIELEMFGGIREIKVGLEIIKKI